MDQSFRLFPEAASSVAPRVDALYLFELGISLFFTGLICLLIVWFVIRYRRSAVVNRKPPPANLLMEASWAVVPFLLSMVMFAWGAQLYLDIMQPPPDCLEIRVVGKQWMWKVQHPGGRSEINELHVPLGRPVRLQMISEDVIHSFYIPNFRVKMDVLPGRYTHLWFEPTKVGTYHLFCAEYCGTSHSEMVGSVVVQKPADYAAWLQGGDDQPAEVRGALLFEQFRCNTCHKQPGEDARGPTLVGLFGNSVQLDDGSVATADIAYLRESILDPSAKVVAGHRPVMPTFQGQIGEEGIFQLISYIQSLTPGTEPSVAEEDPAPAGNATPPDSQTPEDE